MAVNLLLTKFSDRNESLRKKQDSVFGIISGSWCIGMYALWKGVTVSMKDRDNGTVEFRERLQPHEVLSLVGIGVGLGKDFQTTAMIC